MQTQNNIKQRNPDSRLGQHPPDFIKLKTFNQPITIN